MTVLLSSVAGAGIQEDSLDLPPESVVILRLVDPERPTTPTPPAR